MDDDDFSDLYADVEVQASSAISALHRSTELLLRKAAVERDASREEGVKGGGGDLRTLPVEGEGESASESVSESEDGLASRGVERKVGESCERKRYEEISGKEKSVNVGDYISQSQRKYDSSNSKMKRVHEMAQVRRTSRKGDEDDRNRFISRGSEDNQPNYGRKHGGQKITPERHTAASYPVPLDLDKCGSVQISDSVEDSPCEVSVCDSDGISEASDDTNRRKSRCISNKVSSAREPEPVKSSLRERGQGYSSSPRSAALGSRYFGKSPKRSRHSSPSLDCELTDQKYRPPKPSERRGVRRGGTRDGGYRERWKDSMREYSDQPKKSNYGPYFKNRPDEDASYATDAKHLYNRHVNYEKERAIIDHKYIESDILYRGHSERMLTYSGERLPDHHMGQPFMKDQYWWDNPNNRYKAGPPEGHNARERRNFLYKRSSQIDYEPKEYDRYHNQRKHHFQGYSVALKNLSLKYSSAADQRGTQFLYKGESWHLRSGTRQDSLSPLHDRFVEGKHRRILPSSGGGHDHFDCGYDWNVAHDRREVESSSRGNRRRHSPLNSSENLCYIENKVNDRRNIKHRPFPFYSYKEPYASGRGDFLGASGPKTGVVQRNMRCSWKEMHIEYDQYCTDVTTSVPRESLRYRSPEDFHVKERDCQPSSNANFRRESIKDGRCQDHFVGRRGNLHSEVFLPKENVCKSRQQANIVITSEEPSHNYSKRISKNDETGDRPASVCIVGLREREMGRRNSNILGEDSGNHFDGCHESTKLNGHAHMHPINQDSVDRFLVMGRKVKLRKLRPIIFTIVLNISKCLIFVGQAYFNTVLSILLHSPLSLHTLAHGVDFSGRRLDVVRSLSPCCDKLCTGDILCCLHDLYYLFRTIRSSFFTIYCRTFDFDVHMWQCTFQSSIRRTTEAGEDTYYGKSDLAGLTDNKKPNNSEDMDKFKPDEGEVDAGLSHRNQPSKFSKYHQNHSLDIEEGQIIAEEMQNEVESHINASGNLETTSNDNRVVAKLDDDKIKEIITKMERRRERFKEPVMTSRDGEKTFSLLPELIVENADARLERPARKRRWLGT
ncbi:hypothetical protein SASPL_112547 [Salvia splendens]|uniref:Uncharacterized protein n=1 Tax=Salvia splendens TaxID=180675 RepID=A0A8X8YEI8_SALSN|nr:hypothetical protein SASPL_112547 [Salvia splendens]